MGRKCGAEAAAEAFGLEGSPDPGLSLSFSLSLSLSLSLSISVMCLSVCLSVYVFTMFSVALIAKKFEDVHRNRGDDTGMKVLEFCVKKRTDKCNNAINT